MARRNSNILFELTLLPWWVSVILATLAYTALAIILPSIELERPLLRGFQSGLPKLAPIITLLLLIPAPIAAFNAWRKRKQLEAQKSIKTIRDLSWKQFEELVAEAYRRQGYTVVENTRGGADGGVDIRLRKGQDVYLVQCKHWKRQKIGVSVVRELYGVMAAEAASGGSIVCTGLFTQDAHHFAGDKQIDLVDGGQLESMVRQVQPSRPTNRHTAIPAIPDCPRCGSQLVRRRAGKGKNRGNEFWGCSTFPKCRYTKNS
ncbi:MAG: restriction endonuclease [Pseudomonadota bacterium]